MKRNRILALLFLSRLMSYMFPSVVHLHHQQHPPASELLSRRRRTRDSKDARRLLLTNILLVYTFKPLVTRRFRLFLVLKTCKFCLIRDQDLNIFQYISFKISAWLVWITLQGRCFTQILPLKSFVGFQIIKRFIAFTDVWNGWKM